MLSRIQSAALIGIEAVEVTVEVDISGGLPKEFIVGLPDAVVKESKSRVKAAIKNSGFEYPQKVYTVNLAPAELQKEGPFFDLPIAVAILHATGQVSADKDALYMGELALNGEVRPVRGVVCMSHLAKERGIKRLIIPYDNYDEACLIEGVEAIPIKHLRDIEQIAQGHIAIPDLRAKKKIKIKHHLDYQEVKGQLSAKRAVEIAAAGGHNMLFIGPPGSGKTMLLKRLPTILPDMATDEAIEVQKIISVSKRLHKKDLFQLQRPFRNPHHSISYAGMVGGGTNPSPGEISMAHCGVLFLDELPEFPRNVLEVLRQPIEEKRVTISRAQCAVVYPARFMLVAAMNPCPCGYFNDDKIKCQCQKPQIKKYWKKISGPILDRIDLIIELPRLKKEDMDKIPAPSDTPYTSDKMRSRVLCARERQHQRNGAGKPNSELSASEIHTMCRIDSGMKQFLGEAVDRGFLTGRSYDSILKLARTIADLEGQSAITQQHISEAIQYRRPLIDEPGSKS